MSEQPSKRKAPFYTMGEMGLFPPFYKERIDYVGWLIARRYHLWLGIGMSAIIAIEALRIGLAVGSPDSLYWALGLAVLFIASAYVYSGIRRRILFQTGNAFFRFRIQIARTAIAVTAVALLQYGFGRIVPQANSYVWILYIPALAIASEHQSANWAGIITTGALILLMAGSQLAAPILTREFTFNIAGLLLWLNRVAIVISATALIHYFIRNIQKRSLLFEEDRQYTEQMIRALAQVNEADQLWTTCLQICLRRLRAAHGSLWLRYPASGRCQLVKVMIRDGILPESAEHDITDAGVTMENADDVPEPTNLIWAVLKERKALAWSVGNSQTANQLDGVGPALFSGPPGSPFIYQIAAPIQDRGGTGEIIGVLNINYSPGYWDRLAGSWPVVRPWRLAAQKWVVDWERDLLIHTAKQMSGSWEHARHTQTFHSLVEKLPELYADLNSSEVASMMAQHLAETMRTTAFVWCFRERRGGFYLTGASGSEGAISPAQDVEWSEWLQPLLERGENSLAAVPCPESLASWIPFANASLVVFPLMARGTCVGVAALAVRSPDSLASYLQDVVRAYVAEVAYAVESQRVHNAQHEKNEALQRITRQALEAGDIEEFADAVWEAIRTNLDVPFAHVGVIHGGEIEFPTRIRHSHDPLPLPNPKEPAPTAIQEAVRTAEPQLLQAILPGSSPLGPNWPLAKSGLVLPLMYADQRPRGVLVLHDNDYPGRFSPGNVENLNTLASVLGLAVYHIQRTNRWRVAADNVEARYLIPFAMLTPGPDLSLALARLTNELHKKVFSPADFTFVGVWQWQVNTQALELAAIHPPQRRAEESRPETSKEPSRLFEALEGPLCFKTNTQPGDILPGDVPVSGVTVCAAPIRMDGNLYGVIAVGTTKRGSQYDKQVLDNLSECADQLAGSWQRRLEVEDVARNQERIKMRHRTHGEALKIAQHAAMLWHEFRDKWPGLPLEERTRSLAQLAPMLDRLIRLTPIALEKALRGKSFAVDHPIGWAQAVQDVVDVCNAVYDGKRSVEASIDNDVARRLTRAEREALFLVIESALANALAARHVTQIQIRLQRLSAGWLELAIDDNGEGFDFETTLENSDHIGVTSMVELASEIGWKCTGLPHIPGAGTRIRVRRPMPRL